MLINGGIVFCLHMYYSHRSRVDHDSRGIRQLLSRLVFDLAALVAVEYTVAWYSRLRGGNVESILPHIPQTPLPCGIRSKRQKMQVTLFSLRSPGYFSQALVFKNLPKSSVVATPSTNLRLASVTTANSCFPLPSTPPLKNSSSSSSGVSMSMTL
jgi:hypothetical protein